MIVCFILCVVFVPIGVAMNEGCVWLDSFLNNEAEFSDPAYKFMPGDLTNKIKICKFGDGDLVGEFNIQD